MAADAYLRATYDPLGTAGAKARWIENSAGLWVYLTAPFLGAAVAAAVYQFLRAKPQPRSMGDVAEEAV